MPGDFLQLPEGFCSMRPVRSQSKTNTLELVQVWVLEPLQQLFYSTATPVLGSAGVYVAFHCVGIPTAVVQHTS